MPQGRVPTPAIVLETRRAALDPATLEKMNEIDVGGFYVGFSPANHNASKFVDLTIIGRQGRFLR